MKKLLFPLFITLILFSCNDAASKKGAWNNADKETCRSEGKEDSMDSLTALTDKSVDEIIDCMCNILEENFENYTTADSEMNDMQGSRAQELGVMMMEDCFDIDLDLLNQM